MKLRLYVLQQPCSACVILNDLCRQSLEKVTKLWDNVEVEVITVERETAVPHLEVEKLPALFIDGNQVTAGSIITLQQVNLMLKEYQA